jgi:hypothetical protein
LKKESRQQKRAVIEAKQALQDYARSATASLYEAVRLSGVYDSALAKAQRRLDLTDEYDRLINKQKTVVELMREQNMFAQTLAMQLFRRLVFQVFLANNKV